MSYEEALLQALKNKDLVSEYDRLCGAKLAECLKSVDIGGLNLQIDLATGRIDDEIRKFDSFFHLMIWSELPEESFESQKPGTALNN